MPTPYLPMVNAIAPKAPIGAGRMMIAMTPNRTCEAVDQSTRGVPVSPIRRAPGRTEPKNQHLEDLAVGEGADRRVGDDVQQVVDRTGFCAAVVKVWIELCLNVRVDAPAPGARR